MTVSFFLGMAIGLVAVMTPGPVSIAVIDIGASRGRRSGVHAGLGVAGGDLTAGSAALSIIALGSRMPDTFVATTQVLSAGALIVIGVGLIARPQIGHRLTARIDDPFRTMFAITALTPSVFAAWIALFAAVPFAHELGRLVAFASGALASSVMWHLTLGGTSGSMADRITSSQRANVARAGGGAMLAIAAWSLS